MILQGAGYPLLLLLEVMQFHALIAFYHHYHLHLTLSPKNHYLRELIGVLGTTSWKTGPDYKYLSNQWNLKGGIVWQRYREQSAKTNMPVRIPSQIAVDCKSVHLQLEKQKEL